MASITVISRPGKIVADSVTITMHAVMSENHDLSNTITDFPVEEGSNIADQQIAGAIDRCRQATGRIAITRTGA